ncbi:MAG: hypothetical protein KF852_00825 [Saprospiraceae bacterium]|nr:hypothetical protein [Saprospiraceae bacterium]
MRYLFLLFVCMYAAGLSAQLRPTHVYLFDVRQMNDTVYEFAKPKFLTAFNPNGYNNHPAFFSNTELYISSQLPTENQPELYAFDLEKLTKTRVTNTPEGEYSPFRMPDFYQFSAVRMEIAGRDTVQRLWQFPVDRLSNGKPVFKYIKNIGYYQWINSRQAVLFLVGNPNQLVVAEVDYDRLTPIATNPGRCFRMMPDGNLAFVVKSDYAPWKLVKKKPMATNAEPVAIIDMLSGTEDFAVLPDGTFLAGQGSRIYKFKEGTDSNWVQIADLRFYNIRQVTRLSVTQGYREFRLAVVGAE